MVSEGGLELPRRLRGLCDCLRLQEEHEATQDEDNQHEWREGKCKEGNQQVEEPENESAHAVDLRGCLKEYSTIHAGGCRIETLRPPGGLVCKRPGKVSPGEGRSGEVRPAEVHIGEPHPEEVRPAGVGPGEVRPFEARPREAHLRRVKAKLHQSSLHAQYAIGRSTAHLATTFAVPYDFNALQNDWPRFRNLGNTCYLNAVLQCIPRSCVYLRRRPPAQAPVV